MKRLLLVALTVLVTLVGMVGFSRAGNTVEALQATANPTTGAVTEPPATVNAGTEYNWTAYYDPNSGPVTELPATVNAGVPAKAKMYFLTKNSFIGGEAITACDPGFHMASLSEIQDPSSLQYADRSTAAYESLVDGQRLGPPSDHMGWVRTGGYPLTGFPDNCNFWQSSSDQQRGTTMSLSPILGDANPELHASDPMWWHKVQQMCSLEEPVWCVEDPDEHSATKTSKSTQ